MQHSDLLKIRVNWNKRYDKSFSIGDQIKLRASILPPPKSVLPNNFNFARFAYFKQISAICYTTNNPILISSNDFSKYTIIDKNNTTQTTDNQVAKQYKFITIEAKINQIHQIAVSKIKQNMTAPANVVAAGILIGDSAGISEQDFNALRVAGTAHLIAI